MSLIYSLKTTQAKDPFYSNSLRIQKIVMVHCRDLKFLRRAHWFHSCSLINLECIDQCVYWLYCTYTTQKMVMS